MGRSASGPEGAVEPDGQRLGVAQAVVEGLGGLAGQGAPGGWSVMVPEIMIGSSQPSSSNTFRRRKRGLGVQRVEHRLDQDQDVGAALDQARVDSA
jgi:hypothetical protein